MAKASKLKDNNGNVLLPITKAVLVKTTTSNVAEELAEIKEELMKVSLFKGVYANEQALLQAYPNGQTYDDGIWAILTNTDTMWLYDNDTKKWINSGGAIIGVYSVNGKNGDVVLTGGDINSTVSVEDAETTKTITQHLQELYDYCATLNIDIQTISNEIDTINSSINDIEEDIDTINGNITTLSNGLNEAEQNIQELQSDIEAIKPIELNDNAPSLNTEEYEGKFAMTTNTNDRRLFFYKDIFGAYVETQPNEQYYDLYLLTNISNTTTIQFTKSFHFTFLYNVNGSHRASTVYIYVYVTNYSEGFPPNYKVSSIKANVSISGVDYEKTIYSRTSADDVGTWDGSVGRTFALHTYVRNWLSTLIEGFQRYTWEEILMSDVDSVLSPFVVTLEGYAVSPIELANKEDVPTELKDLTGDSTHRVVTDSQISTWNNKASSQDIEDLSGEIENIQEVIPSQASSSNQLADKSFVNSTVQTSTANFRGNWANWASVPMNADEYPEDYLGETTPSTNDYMVVQDATGYGVTYVGTWRFKYSGLWSTDGRNGWHPEYQVNETPLTSAQLQALNSGITASKVSQYDNYESAIADIEGDLSTKQEEITSSNKLSSDLVDDTNKTNKFVTSSEKTTWNNKQNALPTTTTSGKVLKSTSTAGTVEWGDAGSTVTVSSTGVSDGTNTYNASDKMSSTNPVGTGSFSMNRKSGTTIGTNSVAVGYNVTASGAYSHAEGESTTASAIESHAEGYSTTASGQASHAEGGSTRAEGYYSHAEGRGTKASRSCQHVFGEYNIRDTVGASGAQKGKYIEIVGNGTVSVESNARTLDWSGNEWLAGTSTATKFIGGIEYLTTAPTANNTDGLKFVVLSAEPTTYYNGYYYIITEE